MSRRAVPASAVHLRIGRLVVDAGVLDDGRLPHDLDARLQAELSSALQQARADRSANGWISSVADGIVQSFPFASETGNPASRDPSAPSAHAGPSMDSGTPGASGEGGGR